jgi:hypothetical protein
VAQDLNLPKHISFLNGRRRFPDAQDRVKNGVGGNIRCWGGPPHLIKPGHKFLASHMQVQLSSARVIS